MTARRRPRKHRPNIEPVALEPRLSGPIALCCRGVNATRTDGEVVNERLPAMKGSHHVTLKSVFANARDQRQVAAGVTIFGEGDAGDEMFGVISGKVELRRGGELVATVGPDGTFGEMAIISGAPRSLTAVAAERSHIAAINRHSFLFLVHETPTFAIDVMRSLVELIRAQDR
jgi:CRP/FNR family transcriptional regulator, cyclic AMP receptor protein